MSFFLLAGVCYQNSIGGIKSKVEAVRLYTLASNQGLADAQYFLGKQLTPSSASVVH
jgi:TPR repeat protein